LQIFGLISSVVAHVCNWTGKRRLNPQIQFMNWLKIIGITLIVLACLEIFNIVSDYSSGKLKFWPFGVEIGAALMIGLGIFLIKRGNRHKSQMKL
jgi:hypothetical protein